MIELRTLKFIMARNKLTPFFRGSGRVVVPASWACLVCTLGKQLIQARFRAPGQNGCGSSCLGEPPHHNPNKPRVFLPSWTGAFPAQYKLTITFATNKYLQSFEFSYSPSDSTDCPTWFLVGSILALYDPSTHFDIVVVPMPRSL